MEKPITRMKKIKYFVKLMDTPNIVEAIQNSFDNPKGLSIKLKYFDLVRGFNDGKIEIEVTKALYDRYIKNIKNHKGMVLKFTHNNLLKAVKNGVVSINQKQQLAIRNEDELNLNKTKMYDAEVQTGGFISSVLPVLQILNKGIALYKGAKEVHQTIQMLERMMNRPKVKRYLSKYEKNEIIDKFNEEENDFSQIGEGIKLNPLSNEQLDNSLREIKSYKGSMPRDVFGKTKVNKYESYVINLDKLGEVGSHWVCMKKVGDKIYYFDSFGAPPIDEVIKKYGKECSYFWNDRVVQDPNSSQPSCGYLCMAFLKHMQQENNNMMDFLNKFN